MDNLYLIVSIAAIGSALATFIVTYIVTGSTIRNLRVQLGEKKAELKAQEKLLQEKQKVYEKSLSELKVSSENALKTQMTALKSEMTVAAEKVLKSRQGELEEHNRSEMEEIINPLKESIDKMKTAMSENEKNNVKTATELKDTLEMAVRTMGERTAEVGAKADSLSEALTGRPKVQGCWGEGFLEDILSNEGLEAGLHYDREVVVNSNKRPDFVFHFMEGSTRKDLVVDSKVSLTAYVDYVNSESQQEREDALARHVQSVRGHIDELARKDYSKMIDSKNRFADYVLMFMPIDMAYRAAMDADPTLWKYAYSKGVLITTEQTVIPFLKIIRLTWNKYRQDSSIAEMMSAADDIVERVGLFYDSYKDLGSKLKAAIKVYNASEGKLKEDGFSITTSAKKLMQLGAKRNAGKELSVPDEQILLPDEYID